MGSSSESQGTEDTRLTRGSKKRTQNRIAPREPTRVTTRFLKIFHITTRKVTEEKTGETHTAFDKARPNIGRFSCEKEKGAPGIYPLQQGDLLGCKILDQRALWLCVRKETESRLLPDGQKDVRGEA
ncbi:hypothetical protein HHI36_004153 [Cryptolaemus montrouzieri]|uniref:Uncharacterized protein n=1 Tax=Cryptolaemus montrouzieri TaxID=559131 RepID=A0ABD2NRY8_9CUCU